MVSIAVDSTVRTEDVSYEEIIIVKETEKKSKMRGTAALSRHHGSSQL